MKKTTASVLVAGLTAAAGLVATSPAHADPTFPCGVSYARQGDGTLSLHYHNCTSGTQKRKPFSVLYGSLGSCKTVYAGKAVGWIIPTDDHPETWSVIAC
ncbi:hypothetical protein [Actinomadura geliboluensis]|uniref:hypothetical protein n=1 Tax=Actinomadura geliboluensis TaxID=882440 RepID=UPI00371B57B2